ncbi:2-oxo-4-hydroxy-4-carboxy-5-ureidoimidazoline decarboxylase [Mycolicibacterium sp. S2-37]|uniref:2-oxo-4-hydroxy-4-carboxy-5-ureidoimidazoline decarboxylase n=1 Tax=Mycolicibacterium sp. S2-37 TaxID=2810297 RepID=UPI001A947CEA|nr:2-oxo-4-hydroxy-4-carboxy-5-ureidoimidazoline decarboxylase [Mycolicibacterium sp. S2-37]MBO0677720.1 2-oxo-4-hydroxy-4-carboxy-5-ureidoimidazoline decarboxylase [Mycolicibacterium sp. S2-37]
MTPPNPSQGIDRFNARVAALSDADRTALLSTVCASPGWVRGLLAGAPFDDADALLEHADRVLAALSDAEIDAALDGHPRIGARPDNVSSAREQSAVTGADSAVKALLAEGNRCYEERFGHVLLVCASGRSAEDLLAALTERLVNDAATERRIVRAELGKINRLRLQRLLSEPEDP